MADRIENFLPFSWDGFDIQDTAHFSFYNAEMKEDFGTIKAGQTFKSIDVDFQNGKIEVFSEDGESTIHRIDFKLQAI